MQIYVNIIYYIIFPKYTKIYITNIKIYRYKTYIIHIIKRKNSLKTKLFIIKTHAFCKLFFFYVIIIGESFKFSTAIHVFSSIQIFWSFESLKSDVFLCCLVVFSFKNLVFVQLKTVWNKFFKKQYVLLE